MLKDVGKNNKEGQMKKNTEPVQHKKRTYKKKPVVVKTQAQAEMDLMKSLLVYKKSSLFSTQTQEIVTVQHTHQRHFHADQPFQ